MVTAMALTPEISPAQSVFPIGTDVVDDAYPGARANIIGGGPEQYDVAYEGGIFRSRSVEYLHARAGAAVAPVAKASAPAARSNVLSRAQHKDRINGEWLKGETAYIETGKFLLEAKEQLEPNAFKVLVKELEFDPATGRKYMRVAARPILCAPGHKIPLSWTIRYELSKLDDDKLNAAIADGRVHLKMTRKDAIAIRKPPQPDKDSQAAAPPKSKVEIAKAALNALSKDERMELVRGEPIELFLAGMTNDQRDELAERLILQQIQKASPVTDMADSRKFLRNLTGTFYAGCSRTDPADGAQAFAIINRKLAESGRTYKDIVLAWAKPPKQKAK
jgi:hypothetical protein